MRARPGDASGLATVRAADEADVPALTALWRESMALHASLDAAYRPADGAEREFTRMIDRQIGSRDAIVLVAERAGTVVGYLLATVGERPPIFEPQDVGVIRDVCVAAASRRGGIGRTLVAEARSRLAERGVRRVELAVLTANDGARAFWGGLGFRPWLETLFSEEGGTGGSERAPGSGRNPKI